MRTPCSRRRRHVSKPSMPGSITSSTITSYGVAAAIQIASSPLTATSASRPSSRSPLRIRLASVSSSSTTSTRTACLSIACPEHRAPPPRIDRPMARYRPSTPRSPSPRSRRAARALARARRLPRVDPPPRGRASRSSSTRARRPRTAAPARTTCSRASSRTSSRATRRCAATCVPRKAGWDCHGLPVELEIERELGFTTKHEIEDYGVAEFNAQVPRVGAALHRRVERADRADRLLDRHRRRLLHARRTTTSSRSGGRSSRSGTRAC